MSTTFSFRIRDGLESDIEACVALDHRYHTEYVWQMNVHEIVGQWQVTFKTEHLPRVLENTYPADERRLRLALPDEHCFLVAVTREDETEEVIGYLTMRSQPTHRMAFLQDVVVSRPYRGNRIGMRLLNVARNWAREHDLTRLTAEVQTKNFPGINFCQQGGFAFCGFNDRYFINEDIAVFFTQSLR